MELAGSSVQANLEQTPPWVGVIILNWNRWEDTIECLDSLFKVSYPNFILLLIDNGSRDKSPQMLEEYLKRKEKTFFRSFTLNKKGEEENLGRSISWRELSSDKYRIRAILIKSKENYGFAGGNNLGITFFKEIRGNEIKYFLLLNNDVVVDPKFLSELVRVSESYPIIGVASSIILPYKAFEEKSNQYTGFVGANIGKRGQSVFIFKKLEEVKGKDFLEFDWVSGTSMLIRREVLDKVGLLREEFFAYGEEPEFCHRVRKAGYKSVCVPTSIVYHKERKSLGGKSPKITYLITRNHLIYLEEYYGIPKAVSYAICKLIELMWILKNVGKEHAKALFLGILDGLSRETKRKVL